MLHFCCTSDSGEFLVVQVARDGGGRGAVLDRGRRRNQGEKNEIDELGIERVEMDRPLEPHEHTEETIELCDTGARRSKPCAKSGGTTFLAGPQGFEDWFRIEVERHCIPRGKIEEQLLLVVRAGTKNNATRLDKAGEIYVAAQPTGRSCSFFFANFHDAIMLG